MLTFILICIACALFVTLMYNQFNEPEGLLFGVTLPVTNFLSRIKLSFLTKPLFDCMICMSSAWGGLYFYLLSRIFSPHFGLLEVVCAIPVIGGIMVIITSLLFIKEIIEDEYSASERHSRF